MIFGKALGWAWKNVWPTALALVCGYLFYQSVFVYRGDVKAEELPPEQAVFIEMHDNNHFENKPGFGSLLNSLKVWEFDGTNKQVRLRFKTLRPQDNTKALVIYDKDFGMFEKHDEVIPVSSFPYKYLFQGAPLLTVKGLEKDGTAYLEFRGKTIRLKPGDSFSSWSVSNWRLTETTISNHGLYDKKKQFVDMEGKEFKDPSEK